ncbi:MAG: 23S rRNA (uracil(1939)-C(5))-methyltransferase RlmD, partial [Anaerolineae bacterium]|nr:23S rRNA (uracil(1939)-C(5))-methyltransferase RlmD [Anaerolineae bacterium]
GINAGETLILLTGTSEELPELELNVPASVALRTPRGLQPLIGPPWLTEEVLGQRYRVSAESFFQVNTVGAAALVELVTAYADARPGDVVLDAYCGVGLFSLPLAEAAGKVIGIEEAPSACEDFAVNAAGRDNIELHEGPVEAVLPALQAQKQHVDIAVIDPPRGGTGPQVIAGLAGLTPRRIVYVSCDPATLARDAVQLTQAGFQLVEAQPVDLFPQTFHVETIALWESLAL